MTISLSDRINSIFNFLANHWLTVFNSIVGIYVLLPILAPVLLGWGLTRPANLIYRAYSPTCHQMAFRSFFIGGDQPVYPRAIAPTFTDLTSFEEYARSMPYFNETTLEGLNPDLILATREFTGNAQMGFKTAICQRDIGIFLFLFIGGVLYSLVRNRWRIPALPFWLFILIGMGPIGLDGFSQLFGYFDDSIPILGRFVLRESPPYLRFGTGAWFGFCVAWLAIPRLDPDRYKSTRLDRNNPI